MGTARVDGFHDFCVHAFERRQNQHRRTVRRLCQNDGEIRDIAIGHRMLYATFSVRKGRRSCRGSAS